MERAIFCIISLGENMEFVNVSKSFNENLILDNINLKIDKSGLYVIVGESGVGKTTLLNLMAKK